MPSHKPTKDRKPKNDRSLSASAEDMDDSGRKAMEARTKRRFNDVLPSIEAASVTTSAAPVDEALATGGEGLVVPTRLG
jgi:hypothetical protein